MSRRAKQLKLSLHGDLPPKFAPLEQPIVAPFDFDPVTGMANAPLAGLPEQLKKLELLKEYHGVSEWASLAFALALKYVRGFKIVYDDPLAAKMGLPVRTGPKSGRKGKGRWPELTGDRLIATVNFLRVWLRLESDAAACEQLVDGLTKAEGGRRVNLEDRKLLLWKIKRDLTAAKRAVRK